MVNLSITKSLPRSGSAGLIETPGAFERGFLAMSVSLFTKDIIGAVAVTELTEDLLVASCLAAAAQGDTSAYFDLGVAYSTGSHGAECDLIEAHKWFNLAAVAGHEEAQMCRADVADEMTAREIAEAQRRARQWISASMRKAA
jgi:TPR repeat protein